MSNGPEVQQSQITHTRAPQFIEPALANATYSASNIFNGGPESYVSSQGRDLVGQTLRGDFLLPGTNPYLQGAFDRGANAIQNRLDTQFAGAGRNIGASIPAAKQGLSDLATGIFGGNYQAERDRQTQALGYSQQYDPLNQFINRLQGLAPLSGRSTEQYGNVEKKGSLLDYLGQIDDLFG